jgi:hypothetical protein
MMCSLRCVAIVGIIIGIPAKKKFDVDHSPSPLFLPEPVCLWLKMSEDPTHDEEERPAKRFKVCLLRKPLDPADTIRHT